MKNSINHWQNNLREKPNLCEDHWSYDSNQRKNYLMSSESVEMEVCFRRSSTAISITQLAAHVARAGQT